ncbi:MAG TPA: ABC transporter permease [Bacilli bacterium]|nr:ABC transporter permease [Bacilli bacterium]
MLIKKMLRDILKNKSQFITILLMVMIGVMVYSGIEAYMDGMTYTADTFYSENNLQDINVLGQNFTKKDLDDVKKISNVSNAERKLELTMTDNDDEDKSYLVSIIESNDISKFYVKEGDKFDKNKSGVWLDYFYAKENNIKIGDKISFKYDGYVFKEKVLGIIYVPDHVYDVKDASQLMPNHKTYGFVYMSVNETNDFIKYQAKEKIKKETNSEVSDELFNKLNPNFNYLDYIPFNYIMVDVNNKDNNNQVKDDIEKNISNAIATISIEDTSSYAMYQGEIDEGKAYVGIFSGLFLFIALLSVITTMTRVVKNQKLQIGTLKALGFSKLKITMHYVGYGFWVSLVGAALGIILGKYFLGSVFLNLEMSFFEVPNGKVFINPKTYLVALLVIIVISIITFMTSYKELKKKPADSLRNELPKIKNGSLNLTTKGILKKLNFASKWNLRDIFRNKFRTITGIIGIVGCCTLIVCALGMLNSMNYFIKLQFDDLYNFDYKLSLKENISEANLKSITNKYGNNTSETLAIEIKDQNDNRESNTIFVDDSNGYIRFIDDKYNFTKLDSSDGIYVTYKFADKYDIKIGDKVKWHVYGNKKYYESKVVGFYKDPQVQGLTTTKEYIESLGITYEPDCLYTNRDLSKIKNIKDVEVIQNINELKEAINNMLSMMKKMIIIIVVFAVLLGVVIIYNMSILSFGEKEYQFATLKVLGFNNRRIEKIFSLQNSWICIVSIILGLPLGHSLTSYLFKACLDENFDFGVHIELWTYVIAAIGTYLVSLCVSKYLAKKVKNIDMVSSLKANE